MTLRTRKQPEVTNGYVPVGPEPDAMIFPPLFVWKRADLVFVRHPADSSAAALIVPKQLSNVTASDRYATLPGA